MTVTARDVVAPGRADPSRPGAWLTDVMLFSMALIWGVNFSVVKFGTQRLAPLAYNAARVALAAVTLALIAQRVRGDRPSRGDAWRLYGLGILGMGFYQVFFIEGLARSRAGTVALVLAGGPAFIAVISWLLRRERLPSRGWAGIALQIAGIACVVFGTASAVSTGDTLLGVLLCLAGSISWSVYAVLVQPYTQRVATLHVTSLTVAGGATLVVLAALPSAASASWTSLPISVWGAIVYSGIGALVIASLFYYRGVRILGPTRTAMYGNLQPMIALAVAWMLLGEVPTVWQSLGASGIMTGLLLSRTAAPAALAAE